MPPEKKKFQIQKRPRIITSPNDKLAKLVFNLPANEYSCVIERGARDCVTEKKARGKIMATTYFWLNIIGIREGEKFPTHFKIKGVGSVDISRPLNEFDRAVFDACISAQATGAKSVTVDFLFRGMTGDDKKQTTPAEKAAILESIGKMMITQIVIDFSEARKKMKYDAPARLVGAILPCQYVDGVKVNGQETAIIEFLKESPLLAIARAKKQFISYTAALLDLPNQNNTPLVIRIKSYVTRRVHEIIKHKMTPTITFEDVFEKCRFDDVTKKQRQDARKIIFDVMEKLKAEGVIRSFEKIKDGRIYRAVKISYNA